MHLYSAFTTLKDKKLLQFDTHTHTSHGGGATMQGAGLPIGSKVQCRVQGHFHMWTGGAGQGVGTRQS